MSLDRKALLVAFHFPPLKASSGLERTISMVKHLPKFNWSPIVLTATEGAYQSTSTERLSAIPEGTVVRRAFARDFASLTSVAGRYPNFVTVPDRWLNWCVAAVPVGLDLIRRHRPSVIWSTYPIATAHIIGGLLHRISGIPWIADYRDPMVEYDERMLRWSPKSPSMRRARLMIEGFAAKHAAAMTFCTDSALQIAKTRHANAGCRNWQTIANGYDESAFQIPPMTNRRRGRDHIVIIHSGTIYPTPDRDPTFLLRGIRLFLNGRPTGAKPLRLVFRGSGVDKLYAGLIKELGLEEVVHFLPVIGYGDALREMNDADGVLVLQGYTSNPAIPAKLYEYIRSGRPILALTDSRGETAKLIQAHGLGRIAPLDSVEMISEALAHFIADLEVGAGQISMEVAEQFERTKRVAEFTALFDRVVIEN